MDKSEITREMLERCAIPKSEKYIKVIFKDTNDEYYEDETYICWDGICVKKKQLARLGFKNLNVKK